MIQAGLTVPQGFVITTRACMEFMDKQGLAELQKEIFKAFDKLHTKRVAIRSSAVAEDSSNASWAGQFESYLNIDKEHLLSAIQKCRESVHSDRIRAYIKHQN